MKRTVKQTAKELTGAVKKTVQKARRKMIDGMQVQGTQVDDVAIDRSRAPEASKATPAWTDEGQGDGLDYPAGTDNYHSGFSDSERADMVAGLERMDDARLLDIYLAVEFESVRRGLKRPQLAAIQPVDFVKDGHHPEELEQVNAALEADGVEHVHVWKRGVLPGNVHIKQCSFPGCREPFVRIDDDDEWMRIPA